MKKEKSTEDQWNVSLYDGKHSFVSGFHVTFAQIFDRPTPLVGENGLRNWIDMFGSILFDGIPEKIKDQIIAKVEINLKDVLYHEGIWKADYKRIRAVGIK